jgi:hypothetical protein
MMKRLSILIYIVFLSQATARAQGCSDAGFCTMGAMKPDQPFNKRVQLRLRAMEISFYRGTTTLTPIVYVANADLSFSINSKNSFQVKLPYQAVTGRLANTSGIGDISLSFTRNLISKETFDVNFSLGAKIPTNQSDKSIDGFPLPMYYQTSLGTFDFIAGASLITRQWLLATGIQVPLNKNNNQFLWSRWEGSDENPAYLFKYNNANQLQRGTDVMLRVERNFRFSQFNFSAGLLPIYRINRDKVENAQGEVGKDNKAVGLALSGIVTAGYNIDVRNSIRLLAGHKIVQREINPDGLTRNFVSTISYSYRF